MQVVLFRPRQRQRQEWFDRLRSSGYDIKFVHDPERITKETELVVIDTAVARWKEYVRLVQRHEVPIVLLIHSESQWADIEFAQLGVVGTTTQEEETELVFDRFLRPREGHPTDQGEALTQAVFQQNRRSLHLTIDESGSQQSDHADLFHEEEIEAVSTVVNLKSDSDYRRDSVMGSTLSQRKTVRQKMGGRASVDAIPNIGEDPASAPDVVAMQDVSLSEPPLPEDEEQGWMDSRTKDLQLTGDEVADTWLEDPVTQGAIEISLDSPSPRSRDLPSVAAVYAAKGGVGKTTFVLHLAALLAKEERRVCILDLDLNHGTVASMMHIQPNKTIVDLVRRIDNPKASRACLLQTKMGFSIVAAPLQPGTFQMQREQLLAILRFLKEEMDIVLIDTPVHFDSLIKLASEQAEQLLLMTTYEPASMESLARMKPLLSSLRPTPELYLIHTRLVEQAPKDQWNDNMLWPVILELPEDPTISKAARSGQLIASSPCSPYRLRVKQLADRWLGVEPERPGNKRSLLIRLLSNRKFV